MIDRLRTLLMACLLFFSLQVFSGELSPGYSSAYRYFPELADALDEDSDGLLSYDELIKGYHAPYLNKELYQTIRLYLVNFESWQNPVTASLSRNSIELAELSGRVAKYHHEQDNTFWDAWLAQHSEQLYVYPYRRLFPHGLTSITPDNLLQKRFPDCTLIASLASIASSETGKRLIFNYFYTIDEQTFGILFQGITTGILIQFREIEHHPYFAKTRDGGLWLAMLEAAYAQQSKRFINRRRHDYKAQYKYHLYSELKGVYETDAFPILMGSHNNLINPQSLTQERLKERLNSFIDNEKVATVSINPSYSARLGLRPFSGIKTKHAYSLIGYDKEKDIVYIRDPQGKSAAVENIITIIRHKQHLSIRDNAIFEVMTNKRGRSGYGVSYTMTEPQINYLLNQANLGVIDMDKKITSIGKPKSTSERSPANTGIIEMSVEQFISTFNLMQMSQDGPYQCLNNNN
ncbi:C2 family cysteine protease [Endozoicomonas sp. SESOKO2]|uniref:C2 family cysteine protease n=3 Tax=unclassified Endozoicomonas TaxID=2644528 RepID=UPI00214971EA|nr:C2 family cysteine protease [Endozoicomonas sp. SESOKO2]